MAKFFPQLRNLSSPISLSKTFVINSDFAGSSAGEGLFASNSGTAASNNYGSAANGNDDHVGIVQHQTGTDTTGKAGVFSQSAILLLGRGLSLFETLVRLPVVSDGTDTFTYRAGFIDNTGGEATDGVFFRYTHTENSGRWTLVARSNNTETTLDSGVTMTANSWYKLRIEVSADGASARFFINGTLVGTITGANIPTAAGRTTGVGNSIVKSAGTTSRNADSDYLYAQIIFNTPR